MEENAVRTFAATFVTDTTNRPTPRSRRLRRGRVDLVEVADVILALILFATTTSHLTNENAVHHGGLGAGVLALVAFVNCAPLALRTRFPLSALALSGAALVWTSVLVPGGLLGGFGISPAGAFVYTLCMYAVTVRCKPRVIVAAVAVTVLGATFINPGILPQAVFLITIPILLGVLVRVRRSGARQLEEQERRHSGERALLEERQRIARELHDVVAHHMSVIAIQAEAAPYKTADPPPELVESFGEIRASALAGLGELRRVLGVLRTGVAGTTPQPGLSDLDALVDSARSGGVSVTVVCSGESVELPEGVDLSAYRIVQEALSNAMRHAPGSQVQVSVAYFPDRLELEVRNDAVASVLVGGRRGRLRAGILLVGAGTGWWGCGSGRRCWTGAWRRGRPRTGGSW
jgi:signal transduction histidine kinase